MMTRHTARRLAGVLALVFVLSTTGSGAFAANDDNGTGQVIDPDQEEGTGQVVLAAGHADFGATLGDGGWALQIHDDTSTPSYWRDPEDVVLRVSDAAMLEVPDSGGFAFLELPPGTPVHVLPQVEQPGVVWVGWNTQDPALLDALSLGATLRIHAIEGPGDLVAYLQGGNFAEPHVLWSTHEAFPQDAWIELNTHTHANWVFSEPGVYLVDAEFAGDLVSGETLSARGTLRFAVGDATDPAHAFAATLSAPAAGEVGAGEPESSTDPAGEAGAPVWLFVAGGAVALVGAVVWVSASARARRRAAHADADAADRAGAT